MTSTLVERPTPGEKALVGHLSATQVTRPAIQSSPVTTAVEGELYTYDVEASDLDPGDILTYSLDVSPGTMTIESTTGLIQWTPLTGDAGDYPVTVTVSDGELADSQSFTLTVLEQNYAPVIVSAAIQEATEDILYVYDVNATDANETDTLTFSLDAGA